MKAAGMTYIRGMPIFRGWVVQRFPRYLIETLANITIFDSCQSVLYERLFACSTKKVKMYQMGC